MASTQGDSKCSFFRGQEFSTHIAYGVYILLVLGKSSVPLNFLLPHKKKRDEQDIEDVIQGLLQKKIFLLKPVDAGKGW